MRRDERQNGITAPLKLFLLCLSCTGALSAEKLIFEDASFPYRVVCEPGWAEVEKNDSVLILDNTASAKKIRMELYRYSIDTAGMTKNIDWAEFNFSINKELTYSFGRLVFFDTTVAKQLGGYHAYELFAILSDSGGTTWWAEYDRWAKHENYGYFASIFGDTSDLKENLLVYTAMMDSISFTCMNTPLLEHDMKIHHRPIIKLHSRSPYRWHDLLGREIVDVPRYRNRLLVGKRARRCPVR
jgi:hypothetical protein